jgi:hypothetical protein
VGTSVAMRADIDREGAVGDLQLISAKIEENVDLALPAIAPASFAALARYETDIESTNAACCRVQHVEAVPAVFDHTMLCRNRCRQRQNIGAIWPRQRALPDDHHRTFGFGGA